MGKQRSVIRKSKIIHLIAAGLGLAVICVFLVVIAMSFVVEKQIHFVPDYEKIDLHSILEKDFLSDMDYRTLYSQTGLGKTAVDAIIMKNKHSGEETSSVWMDQKKDYAKFREEKLYQEFAKYQHDFFSTAEYDCHKIGWITREERMECEEDQNKAFQITEVKNGDVFISSSTHTAGWRHGHAALVTDAKKGELLEATLWGKPVKTKNLVDWEDYSTFLLLRPKEGIDGDKVAAYAKETFEGVPYGLLTGLPNKMPKDVNQTQCAHLIWYPYKKFGYDIDSNGGWLVTPKDIAQSDIFDVVQVYGMSPNTLWN